MALSSRSRDRADAAAARIGASAFIHDSSDVDATGDLVDAVQASLGPIEILARTRVGHLQVRTRSVSHASSGRRAYRDLVSAPIALVDRVVPGMRQRRWGRAVNVSSTSAREPIAALMLSNAHRAATLAAFRTIAPQVAGEGITMNTLLTGRIATDRMIELAGGSRDAAEAGAAEEHRGGVRGGRGLPVLDCRELHHGCCADGGRQPDARRVTGARQCPMPGGGRWRPGAGASASIWGTVTRR